MDGKLINHIHLVLSIGIVLVRSDLIVQVKIVINLVRIFSVNKMGKKVIEVDFSIVSKNKWRSLSTRLE